MAGERELNFGADATDAQYRIKDDTANGRLILAEDTDGGTVLLEYDESANSGSGGWVFRGPVDLGSNDLSTTGEVSAGSVSAEQVNYSVTVGSPITVEDQSADNDHNSSEVISYADSIGTSATVIFSRNTPREVVAFVTVMVREASTTYAIDTLQVTWGDGVTVVQSRERGTPTGRTYSVSSGDLELAMDSSTTVNVGVTGTSIGVSAP